MKLFRSTAALVISIGAVSYVAAQAGSTSSPTTQATPGNSQNTVTFTGCVQPGSSSANNGQFVLNNASASAPRGSGGSQPGATSAPGGTTTSPGGATTTSPGGATANTPGGATTTPSTSSPQDRGASGSAGGASSSSRPASSQTSLILEGREAEIKQHVGHRVEVTGTIASAERSAEAGSSSTGSATRSGSTTGTTGTATTGSTAAGATSSQRMQVSSVRMISNTCN